ncbi:hypothetical protein D3C78_1146290 [compost metagenome]
MILETWDASWHNCLRHKPPSPALVPPLSDVLIEVGAILDIVRARLPIDDFGRPTLTAGKMAGVFELRPQKLFNGPVPGQSVVRHIESDGEFHIIRKIHRLSHPFKQ